MKFPETQVRTLARPSDGTFFQAPAGNILGSYPIPDAVTLFCLIMMAVPDVGHGYDGL